MKNKPRRGTVTGSAGFGMKTTINKSLLIKTISTHALHGVTSAMTQLCKETCSQKHLSHAGAVQRQNVSNTQIHYSICSKANGKKTKKKQFHVMMKNLFTSSSGSDSMSCGIPRCIAGEERYDTMESREL